MCVIQPTPFDGSRASVERMCCASSSEEQGVVPVVVLKIGHTAEQCTLATRTQASNSSGGGGDVDRPPREPRFLALNPSSRCVLLAAWIA